ncbi:MAG: T9SS type A sorting domain-containing protein [Saprospiraceae bacterium]
MEHFSSLPECPPSQSIEIALSSITITPSLYETPIQGTVTSLVAAGRLLPDPATNIIVERKTIHGTLDVNTNYTFDGPASDRPSLYLGGGAQIVVRAGSSLTLTNVDLFTCDVLAQGIVVEAGGTLIATNCTLNDSRFAIDAKPGATISVTGTGFFDNYIGLNLDMSSAPEADKRVTINALSGNTFSTAQAAINAPFPGMPEAVEARGYCGIRLNDYRDFNVFGGNAFSVLANGMVIAKSTLNIGNMTFDDMNSVGAAAYPIEGFGIHLAGKGNRSYWAHINEMWTTMTFNNCKTGIFANHYAAQVDNTVMTNVTTGIDWTQSPRAEIRLRSNNITARRFGIRSFQNEPLAPNSAMSNNTIVVTTAGGGLTPVTGIEMQEPGLGSSLDGGWPVTKNSVTMNIGGRGILYRNGVSGVLDGNSIINLSQPNNYTGIFTEGNIFANVSRNTITQSLSAGLGTSQGIFSAAGTANTYQCNCLDNTNVGAQFYDLADFTNAVRGNNFNTHTTGLQLGNAGLGDAFIGRQNHTGNLWDLGQIPAGEFGGINWGATLQIIGQSRFDVAGAMGSNPEHPPVDPPTLWFFNNPGSSFTCSSACVFPPLASVPPRVPENYVPSDLDYAIATGTLSANAGMTWKGNYRLYRKMLRQPAMEYYAPQYASFKAAQANLPSGKLAYIAEERAKLFTLGSADQTTDDNYRSSLAQQTANLRAMDSLLQAGATVNMTDYNTLVQQKATNETSYATFLQSKAATRQQQIQSLLTLNAGVGTSTVNVANHSMVNNIVLNLLAADENEPSPANLTMLAAIAARCPIEGGDAVYEARAIVERLTGQTYDDATICGSGNRPSHGRDNGKKEMAASEIVFFPNPANGLLQWTGAAGQAVRVKIFDQLGVLVKDQTAGNSQIDLNSLPNGIYLIRMMDTGGTLLTAQKVSLLKN